MWWIARRPNLLRTADEPAPLVVRSASIAAISVSRDELRQIRSTRLTMSSAFVGTASIFDGRICTTSRSSAAALERQGNERRIGDIAAVPIGHAVDIDGMVQQRQAGRGQDLLRVEIAVAENMQAPVLDPRRRDQQRNPGRGVQPFEIDFGRREWRAAD